ncbi:hypothetical protein [Brevundimonas sp. NPDC058933]|uniref:hypothetical protein n=1 Tax=Brevundimonas sp. NPDC058933 TaxID=3346673 RepID=UPI003BEED80B
MLKNLPKPTTFEQGQRLMFGLMMVGAGIFNGVGAVALTIWFAWLAFKLPAHQLPIIYVLAGSLTGAIVGMMIVLISMAVGGPVGKLKASASREGVSLEASDDDEPRRRGHPPAREFEADEC